MLPHQGVRMSSAQLWVSAALAVMLAVAYAALAVINDAINRKLG